MAVFCVQLVSAIEVQGDNSQYRWSDGQFQCSRVSEQVKSPGDVASTDTGSSDTATDATDVPLRGKCSACEADFCIAGLQAR